MYAARNGLLRQQDWNNAVQSNGSAGVKVAFGPTSEFNRLAVYVWQRDVGSFSGEIKPGSSNFGYVQASMRDSNGQTVLLPVCEDGWNDAAAAVACRASGFTGGRATKTNTNGTSAVKQAGNNQLLVNVECGGANQHQPQDDTCPFRRPQLQDNPDVPAFYKNRGIRITAWESVPPNELSVMQAVANQPVVALVHASPEWYNYDGNGYFMGACSNYPTMANHAVLIVGYTSTAWILRNSWGTGWGDGGYMQLPRARGGNDTNKCGVLNGVSYPVIDGLPGEKRGDLVSAGFCQSMHKLELADVQAGITARQLAARHSAALDEFTRVNSHLPANPDVAITETFVNYYLPPCSRIPPEPPVPTTQYIGLERCNSSAPQQMVGFSNPTEQFNTDALGFPIGNMSWGFLATTMSQCVNFGYSGSFMFTQPCWNHGSQVYSISGLQVIETVAPASANMQGRVAESNLRYVVNSDGALLTAPNLRRGGSVGYVSGLSTVVPGLPSDNQLWYILDISSSASSSRQYLFVLKAGQEPEQQMILNSPTNTTFQSVDWVAGSRPSPVPLLRNSLRYEESKSACAEGHYVTGINGTLFSGLPALEDCVIQTLIDQKPLGSQIYNDLMYFLSQYDPVQTYGFFMAVDLRCSDGRVVPLGRPPAPFIKPESPPFNDSYPLGDGNPNTAFTWSESCPDGYDMFRARTNPFEGLLSLRGGYSPYFAEYLYPSGGSFEFTLRCRSDQAWTMYSVGGVGAAKRDYLVPTAAGKNTYITAVLSASTEVDVTYLGIRCSNGFTDAVGSQANGTNFFMDSPCVEGFDAVKGSWGLPTSKTNSSEGMGTMALRCSTAASQHESVLSSAVDGRFWAIVGAYALIKTNGGKGLYSASEAFINNGDVAACGSGGGSESVLRQLTVVYDDTRSVVMAVHAFCAPRPVLTADNSFFDVAARYGITLADLFKANPQVDRARPLAAYNATVLAIPQMCGGISVQPPVTTIAAICTRYWPLPNTTRTGAETCGTVALMYCNRDIKYLSEINGGVCPSANVQIPAGRRMCIAPRPSVVSSAAGVGRRRRLAEANAAAGLDCATLAVGTELCVEHTLNAAESDLPEVLVAADYKEPDWEPVPPLPPPLPPPPPPLPLSEVPVGSQFTSVTGVPTSVPTQARLLAVSYNVAKSVGVENDAVTTTVEGAYLTTVYEVGGSGARRLLEELLLRRQEEVEEEEVHRLQQAKQQQQQLESLTLPRRPQCKGGRQRVESALATGLCVGLKLSNCSRLTVSCLSASVVASGAATFPAIVTDAVAAALTDGGCNAVLLATFAMPNANASQQAVLTQTILSTPIIAPGFGGVPPPASTADVAASALLRTVVVNTGKTKTPAGGNGTAAALAISGAMVAASVAATFGLPPDQVVLVTSPDSPSGGETAPTPPPGSVPGPNIAPDSQPPSGGTCSENPKFGSLCGAAAVGAIVGVAVGGALVLGLAALMIFSTTSRRRDPIRPLSTAAMYGNGNNLPYTTTNTAYATPAEAALAGPWSALGPGASLGAAAARFAAGDAPGAPSAPWHDRDVQVGAAAAAAATAAGAVLMSSRGPGRANTHVQQGGALPRWSNGGGGGGGGGYTGYSAGAIALDGGVSGGGANGGFLDISQMGAPPPPGPGGACNAGFDDIGGHQPAAPRWDSPDPNAMAAAAAAARLRGYSSVGGGSPSRPRLPALVIVPLGGLGLMGSLASPAPASPGPDYGYRRDSEYTGRGPQGLAAAASPGGVGSAARYSNRAAGYGAYAAATAAAAADGMAAGELRWSRGAATMAHPASTADSQHPYVSRTNTPHAASRLGGAGGEPLPRYAMPSPGAGRPANSVLAAGGVTTSGCP
ncbi:hypothetical protein HXX76_008078 [Chlamydomonas incerta]|uniref:SRCR domain-containing protein n=1 Tax=Chlamydomonas incerta TaxID=51695 RepID=A0A835T764_CHLIN|nr:hypothetical protein HXX76_008078 [Chlamydomonas incerta]|eukprot:KAG2433710.1 hypothetical protein HXX76_008078 [Chlamydomonas incerta]